MNAGQPASNRGQVAIASPAISEPALRPSGSRGARRVARDVQHLERADRRPVRHRLVDRARAVLRPPEEDADLERIGPERLRRLQPDRLRPPLAGDDVGLPLVREHGRAGLALQRGEPAEVRAVRVGEHDPLQVARAPAELPDRGEDAVRRRRRRACR